MSTATDDARETEEMWGRLRDAHNRGECEPNCPYCEEDFEPLFSFQYNGEK